MNEEKDAEWIAFPCIDYIDNFHRQNYRLKNIVWYIL